MADGRLLGSHHGTELHLLQQAFGEVSAGSHSKCRPSVVRLPIEEGGLRSETFYVLIVAVLLTVLAETQGAVVILKLLLLWQFIALLFAQLLLLLFFLSQFLLFLP